MFDISNTGYLCELSSILEERYRTIDKVDTIDEILDKEEPVICASIEAADEVEVVLNPPVDGADSDLDDCGSDDDETITFMDLGRGILGQ